LKAAQIACRELKQRFKKVKTEMDNHDPTWQEVLQACMRKGVDITARHM